MANGFENIIRGILLTHSYRIDLQYDDLVHQIPTSDAGQDLLAMDIMHARMNGLPNYIGLLSSFKSDHGIYSSPQCPASLVTNSTLLNQTDPLFCFLMITASDVMNPSDYERQIADELCNAYCKVMHIDGIIGLLAEPHIPGISFSHNMAKSIGDEFRRKRDGDRYWFEHTLDSEDLLQVKNTTMKDLLLCNFDINLLSDNIFGRGIYHEEVLRNCTD